MIKKISRHAALALALIAAPAAAQDAPPEQSSIEAGLVPPVIFRGEEDARTGLADRMAELAVPNASVAVFRNGELAWAQAYGEGVDSNTLFQAASLSKAVAAAGIIALALDRGTGLDADISGELEGLDLAVINPEGLPISLRGLLSHTNGASVSGFPGYAVGEPVPTTAQVVLGEAPANTGTVVLSSERSGRFSYSGGGYTIAQYWAETVTGEPFPAIMRRYVLDPLGMERSDFATRAQEDFPEENVAPAFLRAGVPVEGGWHVYPEHAAASLWTTPTEYGYFVAELMDALDGDPGAGLPIAVAREMTTPVDAGYGLGVGVAEVADAPRLSHSGSNMGYKSNFMAYPASDDLVVVMTSAESGGPLMGDIGRTASIVYGWPHNPLPVHERLPASESELAASAGEYRMASPGGPVLSIRPSDSGLQISLPEGPTFHLVRIGEATFIDPPSAQEATFTVAEDGTVSLFAGGSVFLRQ